MCEKSFAERALLSVREKSKGSPCAWCGEKDFEIIDSKMEIPGIGAALGFGFLNMPVVMVVCTNCGQSLFFKEDILFKGDESGSEDDE